MLKTTGYEILVTNIPLMSPPAITPVMAITTAKISPVNILNATNMTSMNTIPDISHTTNPTPPPISWISQTLSGLNLCFQS